jgi:hypothetical protein
MRNARLLGGTRFVVSLFRRRGLLRNARGTHCAGKARVVLAIPRLPQEAHELLHLLHRKPTLLKRVRPVRLVGHEVVSEG